MTFLCKVVLLLVHTSVFGPRLVGLLPVQVQDGPIAPGFEPFTSCNLRAVQAGCPKMQNAAPVPAPSGHRDSRSRFILVVIKYIDLPDHPVTATVPLKLRSSRIVNRKIHLLKEFSLSSSPLAAFPVFTLIPALPSLACLTWQPASCHADSRVSFDYCLRHCPAPHGVPAFIRYIASAAPAGLRNYCRMHRNSPNNWRSANCYLCLLEDLDLNV